MMKAVLCLALVCCFVAGALSAGCECEGMKNCFCLPATKEGMIMTVLCFLSFDVPWFELCIF